MRSGGRWGVRGVRGEVMWVGGVGGGKGGECKVASKTLREMLKVYRVCVCARARVLAYIYTYMRIYQGVLGGAAAGGVKRTEEQCV